MDGNTMRLLIFSFIGALIGGAIAAGLGIAFGTGFSETMALEVGVYTVVGLISGAAVGFVIHAATFRAKDPGETSVAVRLGLGRGFGGGFAGGVVIIVIAVPWFLIGYFAMERIYFFPIVMFVLGIAAIVKGIMSADY